MSYPAHARSAQAHRVCALRALGLLRCVMDRQSEVYKQADDRIWGHVAKTDFLAEN